MDKVAGASTTTSDSDGSSVAMLRVRDVDWNDRRPDRNRSPNSRRDDTATQRQARGTSTIDRVIVEMDRRINEQLDAILHHPRFQRLEASWRGLHYLASVEAEYDEELSVKIRVLNVSWSELAKDVTRALEFDQSQLFRKIYSSEFDMPGGEPFGVMLGDYEIAHGTTPGVPVPDTEVLQEIARVAMAALCPFVANASSALLGLDSFRELTQPLDLDALFRQTEYRRWSTLRRDTHSRFLALTVPRVLMRAPYDNDGTRLEGIQYREDTHSDPEDYLWGSACYALGGVILRAYANTGWFADLRGGPHEFGEGGMVPDLEYVPLAVDRERLGRRFATEVMLDDFTERALSDAGLIPLCSYHTAERSVFYSTSSLHDPPDEGSEMARLNARLSAMLQYVLCVSRFGHYIKVIGREKVGRFATAEELQQMLQDWLHKYTTSNESASASLKARYPLAASRVEVSERPGDPGHFNCVVHLQPHFQLDQLVSTIRLVTEIAVGPTSAAE